MASDVFFHPPRRSDGQTPPSPPPPQTLENKHAFISVLFFLPLLLFLISFTFFFTCGQSSVVVVRSCEFQDAKKRQANGVLTSC